MPLFSFKILVHFLLINAICFTILGQSSSVYRLEGFIYDQESGMPLFGATIFIKEISKGVLSDEKGHYEVDIPAGKYEISYSYLGYDSKSLALIFSKTQSIDIKLKPSVNLINEVVVSSKKADQNISSTETGQITITKKEIENLPFLLGEVDPIRTIQLMPGVQNTGEGNTGFYVRGGAGDQNLMLLDNAIVYNPSHLFGFFSVFNGSVINSVDLYKSGIPSCYGGRLSSITKVNTRKGNTEQYKAEGGVGVVAANLLIEGPLKRDKGSFLISGRRTYIDIFANSLKKLSLLKQDINYYFYDFNLNLDYKLTPDDNISLRCYGGKDDFKYLTESSFSNTIKWGNQTGSLSWQHFFNDHLDGTLSITTTGYNMDFGAKIHTYKFNILSDIWDTNFNYQINLSKKRHHLSFGITYTYHLLKPNNVNAFAEDVELDFNNKVKLQAEEQAIFINDKIELSPKVEINAGIRFSGYSQRGPFIRYVEDDNLQIIDTVSYKRNKIIRSYFNAEPRVALRYSLNESSSLKVSYDKTNQYIHMAPLSSVSLPMDMWVPSSSNIKPQSAHQFSGGYFRNLMDNKIEGSLVGYFKQMKNQIEYRDGVIIGYSKGFNFDDNFVFGKGLSYGLEFMLKKSAGKLNGLISYTLSKTTRQFASLNLGKAFPAKYDRLHDFSALVNYNYSERWTFSGIFVYATGNALNLPVARYIMQGNVINEYGPRNSFRMPAYHRLDLSITYTAKKTKRFESFWNFSIYNVYNRRNPYYIYFENKGDIKEYKLETALKQVSLFPIIPSLAYRFKF